MLIFFAQKIGNSKQPLAVLGLERFYRHLPTELSTRIVDNRSSCCHTRDFSNFGKHWIKKLTNSCLPDFL